MTNEEKNEISISITGNGIKNIQLSFELEVEVDSVLGGDQSKEEATRPRRRTYDINDLYPASSCDFGRIRGDIDYVDTDSVTQHSCDDCNTTQHSFDDCDNTGDYDPEWAINMARRILGFDVPK